MQKDSHDEIITNNVYSAQKAHAARGAELNEVSRKASSSKFEMLPAEKAREEKQQRKEQKASKDAAKQQIMEIINDLDSNSPSLAQQGAGKVANKTSVKLELK